MARAANLPSREDLPFGCPPDRCSCGKIRIHTFIEGKPICRKCFARLLRRANPRMGAKYGNKRVRFDNKDFPSIAQAERWGELLLLQDSGKISHLQHEVPFSFDHEGEHIGIYRADAVYFEGPKRVVEDVKGCKTAEYRLKKRLMKAFYKIEILEIPAKGRRTPRKRVARR